MAMAIFLSADGTMSQLETIINSAKTDLVLISPFVKLPDTLLQCIKNADKRRVKIKLVFTKAQMNQGTIDQLKQLANLSMYYSQNLHAKCYFNETAMIITSLSLNNLSEPNNIEMGVLVTKESDTNVYNAAVKKSGEIIRESDIISLETAVKDKQEYRNEDTDTSSQVAYTEGFCIRCKKEIVFYTSTPYCINCYYEWTEWDQADPDYKEKYCHHCGNKWATSLESPLCSTCSASDDATNEGLLEV